MRRYSFIKCFMLAVTLLTSQVGSAFAVYPAMQDCDMDMSASGVHSEHSMMAMDSMMKGEASIANNVGSKMDCCDMTISASGCASDCQCTAFVTSIFFLHSVVSNSSFKNSIKPITRLIAQRPSPYIQQLNRPPISLLS